MTKEDEELLIQFFHDLRDHQEPLGEEFEEVLYNNLWELINAANKELKDK